jgi:hypothetical protein
MAHKSKSLFVPCCGTFCVFLWHMVLYYVPSELQVKNCKSRIASQELQVNKCKSIIASQELQVKNCKKSLLDSLDIFFSRLGLMNERIFSLVFGYNTSSLCSYSNSNSVKRTSPFFPCNQGYYNYIICVFWALMLLPI